MTVASTQTVRYCRNPTCPNPTVPLDPERVRRHNATTCDDRCRAAAWKAERGYGCHRPVGGRANGRVKPSGLQLSYRKAVSLVAYNLMLTGMPRELAVLNAEQILWPALSERQRQQLQQREEAR